MEDLEDNELYKLLAKKNNLVETNVPNVWVRNEYDGDSFFKIRYTLTKLGFQPIVKFKEKSSFRNLFNFID